MRRAHLAGSKPDVKLCMRKYNTRLNLTRGGQKKKLMFLEEVLQWKGAKARWESRETLLEYGN